MRTRSRRISHAVPFEGIESIFSFLEDGMLACLVRGGAEYSPAAARALKGFSGAGAVTVKSLLATRREPLRVPEAYTLRAAVEAARDGDTILVSRDVGGRYDAPGTLHETIRVPTNIRLRIMAARRTKSTFGRRQKRIRATGPLGKPPRTGTARGSLSFFAAASKAIGVYSAIRPSSPDGPSPALLVEGEGTSLTLRDISFFGISRDYGFIPPWIDPDDDGPDYEPDAHDTAICAYSGARLKIENCSFACFGFASVFAWGGSKVHVSDSLIGRSWFGIKAESAETSVTIEECRFTAEGCYAVCSFNGANVEVVDSCVGSKYTRCNSAGFSVFGEGSRMKIDQLTYRHPTRGAPFFVVLEWGTMVIHCDQLYDPHDDNLRLLQDKAIDFGLFPGREWSGAGKTEPVPEGYAIIHSSGWQG